MAKIKSKVSKKSKSPSSDWEILPIAQKGQIITLNPNDYKPSFVSESTGVKKQNIQKPVPQKKQEQTIKQSERQSIPSKAAEVLLHPLTAISNYSQKGYIPDNFSKGELNPIDYAMDAINPAFYVKAAGNTLKSLVTPQTYTDIPKTLGAAAFLAAGENAPSELNEAAFRTLGVAGDALVSFPFLGAGAIKGFSETAKRSPFLREQIYKAIEPVGYGAREKILKSPKTWIRNTFLSSPEERALKLGKGLISGLGDKTDDELIRVGKNRLDAFRTGLRLPQKFDTFENIGEDLYRIKNMNPSSRELGSVYSDLLSDEIKKLDYYTGEDPLISISKRFDDAMMPSLQKKDKIFPYSFFRENVLKQPYDPWIQKRLVESSKNPNFTHSVYDIDRRGIMGSFRWDVNKPKYNEDIHFQSNDIWNLNPWEKRGQATVEDKSDILHKHYFKPFENIEALSLMGGKPFKIQNNFIVDPKNYRIKKSFKQGGSVWEIVDDKAQSGKIINDNMGQWKYPGEITRIEGNTMATHGYGDIPLYVVPNKGEPKLVLPNTGIHEFKGADSFTEYPLPEAGSGYRVIRSNERKGKTHKVIGPDGTVKFFGDSKLGQHPKDPARKKAFYARHKKNLAKNPYFRAFARKTWADGGEFVKDDDSTLENLVEFVDPIGYFSWDDVKRSYKNTGLSPQTALEVLGALPLLGKIGKSGKVIAGGMDLLHTLAPIMKNPKAQKALYDTYRTYKNVRGDKLDKALGYTTQLLVDNTKLFNPTYHASSDAAINAINKLEKVGRLSKAKDFIPDASYRPYSDYQKPIVSIDNTRVATPAIPIKEQVYIQKAPLPGQSVQTMGYAQGGMLPDLAAMAFGGNLILEKYQEGGDVWEIIDDFEPYQYQKGGKVVSELWQEVTGTPWKEAKKRGFTTGKEEDNLKLRKELLSNPERFTKSTRDYKMAAQPVLPQNFEIVEQESISPIPVSQPQQGEASRSFVSVPPNTFYPDTVYYGRNIERTQDPNAPFEITSGPSIPGLMDYPTIGNLKDQWVLNKNLGVNTQGNVEKLKVSSGAGAPNVYRNTGERCIDTNGNLVPECAAGVQLSLDYNTNISGENRKKLGIKGDAWTMGQNILNSGGQRVYGLVDENVDRSAFSSSRDVKNYLDSRKKELNVKPSEIESQIQNGDFVEMWYEGSPNQQKALREGKGTITTHIGIVTEKNGKKYVTHNIHGNWESNPLDQALKGKNVKHGSSVMVSGIVRPDYLDNQNSLDAIGIQINPKAKYYSAKSESAHRVPAETEWKSKTPLNRDSQIFTRGLAYYAPKVQDDFNLSDKEMEQLMKLSFGLFGKESGFGEGASYKDKEEKRKLYEAYKEMAPDWAPEGDELSKGKGQIKLNAVFNTPEKKALLAKYGITKENIWDTENTAAALLLTTAMDYKNFSNFSGANFKNMDPLTLQNVLALAHNKGLENVIRNEFTTRDRRTVGEKLKKLFAGEKDWSKKWDIAPTTSMEDKLKGFETYSNLHLNPKSYANLVADYASSLNVDYNKIKDIAKNYDAFIPRTDILPPTISEQLSNQVQGIADKATGFVEDVAEKAKRKGKKAIRKSAKALRRTPFFEDGGSTWEILPDNNEWEII